MLLPCKGTENASREEHLVDGEELPGASPKLNRADSSSINRSQGKKTPSQLAEKIAAFPVPANSLPGRGRGEALAGTVPAQGQSTDVQETLWWYVVVRR